MPEALSTTHHHHPPPPPLPRRVPAACPGHGASSMSTPPPFPSSTFMSPAPGSQREGGLERRWPATTFVAVLAVVGARLLVTHHLLPIFTVALIAVVLRYTIPYVAPRAVAFVIRPHIHIGRIGARGVHRLSLVLPKAEVHVGHIALRINRPSAENTSSPTNNHSSPSTAWQQDRPEGANPTTDSSPASSASARHPSQVPALPYPWLTLIVKDARVSIYSTAGTSPSMKSGDRTSTASIFSRIPSHIPGPVTTAIGHCTKVARAVLSASVRACMHALPFVVRVVDIRCERSEIIVRPRPLGGNEIPSLDSAQRPPVVIRIGEARVAAMYSIDRSRFTTAKAAASHWMARLPDGILSIQLFLTSVSSHISATSPLQESNDTAALNSLWEIPIEAQNSQSREESKTHSIVDDFKSDLSRIPCEQRVFFSPGTTAATFRLQVGDPAGQRVAVSRDGSVYGQPSGSMPADVDLQVAPAVVGLDALHFLTTNLGSIRTPEAPRTPSAEDVRYNLIKSLERATVTLRFVRFISSMPASPSTRSTEPQVLAADIILAHFSLRRATPNDPICTQWLGIAANAPASDQQRRGVSSSLPTSRSIPEPRRPASPPRPPKPLAHLPRTNSSSRSITSPPPPILLCATFSLKEAQVHMAPGIDSLASIGPVQASSAVAIPSQMVCTQDIPAGQTRPPRSSSPAYKKYPTTHTPDPPHLSTPAKLNTPEPHEFFQCTLYTDVDVGKVSVTLSSALLDALKFYEASSEKPSSLATASTVDQPLAFGFPQVHLGFHMSAMSLRTTLPAPPPVNFPTQTKHRTSTPHRQQGKPPALKEQLACITLPSLDVVAHSHYAPATMQVSEIESSSQYSFDTHLCASRLTVHGGPQGGEQVLLTLFELVEMRCSGALPAFYPDSALPSSQSLLSPDLHRGVSSWPIHRLPSVTLHQGDVTFHTLVDGVKFSLDQPTTWDTLASLALFMSQIPSPTSRRPDPRRGTRQMKRPAWTLHKAMGTLALRDAELAIASVDKVHSQLPVGVRVSLARATVEIAVSPPPRTKAPRFAWDPRQTYGLEQTALDRASSLTAVYGSPTSVTLCTLNNLEMRILNSASCAPGAATDQLPTDGTRIFSLPSARTIVNMRPVSPQSQRAVYFNRRNRAPNMPESEKQAVVQINVDLSEHLDFSIQLCNTYMLLMAGAGIRRIVRVGQSSSRAETVEPAALDSSKPGESTPNAEGVSLPRKKLEVNVSVRRVSIPITLPLGMQTFVSATGLRAIWRPQAPLQVHWEMLIGAPKRIHPPPIGGSSIPFESTFNELLRSKNGSMSMHLPLTRVARSQPAVTISGDSLLLSIPYNFRVYELVDATTVSMKATKQMFHEIFLGHFGNWLRPSEQSPVRMPTVQFSFKRVVFEGEDDPFESALGRILCTGKTEALRRLERKAAFDNKMTDVFKHTDGGCSSPDSTSSMEGPPLSKHQEIDTGAIVREARMRLAVFDASSWIERIQSTKAVQQQREESFRSHLFGRNMTSRNHLRTPHTAASHSDDDSREQNTDSRSESVEITSRPAAPPLFRLVLSNPLIRLSEPSFGRENTKEFITKHGGPIPAHLRFSICVPFHLHWEMDEALMQIRDYPLPLVHVSSDIVFARPLQTDIARPRAWVMQGDLCIAEQMGGPESTRYVPAPVSGVPSSLARASMEDPYIIHVPKVSLPTKWFGAPVVTIRSGRPLHVSWGPSYQAAVADMVRTFDSFSRPPTDLSRKIGFWDKIPLLFHGELSFEFPPTEGDKPGEPQSGVHLYLKGSRDPYALDGFGAGWVMCWHNGVTVTFGRDNPEMEVLQFKSSKFILGIPDLTCYGPQDIEGQKNRPNRALDSNSGLGRGQGLDGSAKHNLAGLPILNAYGTHMSHNELNLQLQKTVWHLGGAVTWGLGFILERTCSKWDCRNIPRCQGEPFNRKCRFFDKISHWQVITKAPEYFKNTLLEQRRDTYLGWRHDHIHFSIGVRSHEVEGTAPVKANSLHVTPLTSAHFWAWMGLYRSSLGLPIRQGPLFDSPQRPPKFGPHLATIKYRLDLAPLYFSHVYLQQDVDKYRKNTALYVGLKSRVDTFEVDVHQRQQATEVERKGLGEKKKVLHKPINELEVNFHSLEVRAVCAELTDMDTGHVPDTPQQQQDDTGDNDREETATDRFLYSGTDASNVDDGWWDLDDYVELGAFVGRRVSRPSATRGRTEAVLQCPAFNYYKKLRTRKEITQDLAENGLSDTDEDGGDLSRTGRRTHRSVLFATESKFGSEDTHTCMINRTPTMNQHQQRIVRQRLRSLRHGADSSSEDRRRLRLLSRYYTILKEADLPRQPEKVFSPVRPRPLPLPINVAGSESLDEKNWINEVREMEEQWGLFSNRYLFYCPIVFISDVTRGILTKYYHSNRERRGFAHYLRAQALRTIRELDLGSRSLDLPDDSRTYEEKDYHPHNRRRRDGPAEHASDEGGLGQLRNVLRDMMLSFNPHGDKGSKDTVETSARGERFDATVGIHPDFDVRMSTLCVLMRPQIVLRNEKEDSSVILSATLARLHNYTVRDYDFVDDDVNQQVMHRNMIAFDQMQCWHPPVEYKHGLPFEHLLSSEKSLNGLEPIIPRTNCNLHYDTFNKLRLQDASKPCADLDSLPPDQDHLRYNMDLVRIHCPKFSVYANQEQFAALDSVTTGLVLYRDPAFKAQTKQLETILFAYNFHDPEELADIIETLQCSIHHAQRAFSAAEAVYTAAPTQSHHEASVEAYRNVVELRRELGLFNSAISVAQDRRSGSDKEKRSALLLETRADEVGWSMMLKDSAQSLADFGMRGVHFQWLNKADNSALNRLVINDLHARNNRPDALFTDMIAKYTKNQQGHWMVEQGRFLDVTWAVLAPVGGISLIHQFELNLHPLRVQLEIAVGREVMAYIFGKRDASNQSQNQQQSPDSPSLPDKHKGYTTTLQTTSHSGSFQNKMTGGSPSLNTANTNESKRKLGAGPSLSSLHAPLRGRSQSLFGNALSRARDSTDTLPPAVADGDANAAREHHSHIDDESLTASGHTSSTMQGHKLSPGATRLVTNPVSNETGGSIKTTPMTQMSVSDHDKMSQFGISVRDEGHAIALRSAIEMRERAAMNRTFVSVKIPQTVFCLSFKGNKGKSITDLYDVVVKSPKFEYHNQTWAYEDMVNHFKRELVRAAWNQRTTLLRGFLTQRPHTISTRLALREKIRAQAWAQKKIQDLEQAARDARASVADDPEDQEDSRWLDQALRSPPLSPTSSFFHETGSLTAQPSNAGNRPYPQFVLGVQPPTGDDTPLPAANDFNEFYPGSDAQMLVSEQEELVTSPTSSVLTFEDSRQANKLADSKSLPNGSSAEPVAGIAVAHDTEPVGSQAPTPKPFPSASAHVRSNEATEDSHFKPLTSSQSNPPPPIISNSAIPPGMELTNSHSSPPPMSHNRRWGVPLPGLAPFPSKTPSTLPTETPTSPEHTTSKSSRGDKRLNSSPSVHSTTRARIASLSFLRKRDR